MESRELALEFLEAWNRHCPDAIADKLNRASVYLDNLNPRKYSKNEIVAYAEVLFRRYPGLRFDIVGPIAASPQMVAMKWSMQGLRKGKAAIWAHLGKWIDGHGAIFLQVENRRIHTMEVFFHVATEKSTVPPHPVADPPGREPSRKYRKSGLSRHDLERFGLELIANMDQDLLFLDPNLSLASLAKKLKLSPNHLSQIINTQFKTNFFGFLNYFRIREAQKALAKVKLADTSILNIAMAVGFNSKSAFNGAFKSETGMTPTQYRRGELARKSETSQ